MSRTLIEIFDETRDYLDLDETDMSNTVMLHWAHKGFNRIQKELRNWHGNEVETSIATSDGVQTYTHPIERGKIAQIFGPSGVIAKFSQNEAERRFGAGFSDNNTSEPQGYSVFDNELFFWPVPNDTYTYTVRGYEDPSFDSTLTETPSLPNDEAHELLLDYVLAEAQMHQDDYFKANWWQQEFETGLKQLASDDATATPYEPVVVGGRRSPSPLLRRGRWPGSNFPA